MAKVSSMLDHVSSAFTMQVYSHIAQQVKSQVAKAAAIMPGEAMRMAELLEVGNVANEVGHSR